ncbi:class I SAM-dependent methyltransferase [Maridesulfovibrio sp.]|uniref:class I SAM-dependent methyltransferase n=1 Tax=Maridesulfovibrio sp. TaxID=2795000 RepID=UPI003AFFF124
MNLQKTASWKEVWSLQMEDMAARSNTDYWNRRAEDYNDFITSSRFGYGEKMCDILTAEEIINADSSVLEIASGVGAVTLPFARRTKEVIAVEPAQSMAKLLEENAASVGIKNIKPEIMDFDSFAAKAQDNSYDLVFLCHAAWQFPDIEKLISEMSRISRGFCCLADTMGIGDAENHQMQRKLGIKAPELDRSLYLYNILNELGRPADISNVNYTMRRSTDSARSMWTNLVSKYRTVSTEDRELIEQHVTTQSNSGFYEVPAVMSLMWWRS